MTGRRAAGLLAIFVLAVAVRLAADAGTPAADAPPQENRRIARSLEGGRGFSYTAFGVTGPTAVRGPAYPFLLALVGPDHMKRVLAVNAVAGGLAAVGVFFLARRLAVPPAAGLGGNYRPVEPPPAPPGAGRAAWPAAVAFAVWPTQVYAATLAQGLSLAAALTVVSLAVAWRRTPAALIAAGFLAGLAVLTEPVLALPLALAAVPLGRRRHARGAAVFLAVAAVTLLPWLYRNAIVFGRPTPLTSNFWRDAFCGNGREAVWSGDYKDRIARLPPPQYDRLKVPEPQRAAVFRGWTLDWVRGHPLDYAGLCVRRAVAVVFGPLDHPLAGRAIYLVCRSVAACGFFVLPFLAGRGQFAGVCLALTLGLVAATAFTLVEARLSVLTDLPQLLALSAAVARPRRAA